jgi:carbonic anhydrase
MHQQFRELLRNNSAHAEEFRGEFDDLQDSQRPEVVTVCCSDSRVLQDQMWNNDDPGHLFTCSNIGNRVTQQTAVGETVSGDVLYPIAHTGTELAAVVGHTGCGAITAAYDGLTETISEPPGIAHCLERLGPSVREGAKRLPEAVDRAGSINRLVEYNVDRQVECLATSGCVPDAVTVVGCVYDFQDVYGGRRGEIHVCNVDGETRVETLRDEHPEIGPRVRRLWEY